MRDLYRSLGVSANASPRTIRAAINRCSDHALRGDAEAVLLNSQRRRQYDRVHARLTEIGQLRYALELNTGTNWRGRNAADFSSPGQKIMQSAASWPSAAVAIVLMGLVAWTAFPSMGFRSPPVARPDTHAIVHPDAATEHVGLTISNETNRDQLLLFARPDADLSTVEFYVRAHERTNANVPIGPYKVAYVTGEEWLGDEQLFGGKATVAAPASSPLTFERTDGLGYELRVDPEGNTVYFKPLRSTPL